MTCVLETFCRVKVTVCLDCPVLVIFVIKTIWNNCMGSEYRSSSKKWTSFLYFPYKKHSPYKFFFTGHLKKPFMQEIQCTYYVFYFTCLYVELACSKMWVSMCSLVEKGLTCSIFTWLVESTLVDHVCRTILPVFVWAWNVVSYFKARIPAKCWVPRKTTRILIQVS
jgi:hypothetical protein